MNRSREKLRNLTIKRNSNSDEKTKYLDTRIRDERRVDRRDERQDERPYKLQQKI